MLINAYKFLYVCELSRFCCDFFTQFTSCDKLTQGLCVRRLLTQKASSWLMDDLYRNPGPIQYAGAGADLKTITLLAEDNDYIGKVQELCAYLDKAS